MMGARCIYAVKKGTDYRRMCNHNAEKSFAFFGGVYSVCSQIREACGNQATSGETASFSGYIFRQPIRTELRRKVG
jgi:hypothetical protein